MSLKIKPSGSLWNNVSDGDYNFDDMLNRGIQWPSTPTLKMSMHPDWLELMDQLEVGDIVTNHRADIGVITKIYDITALGMKKYEVLIGNEREIFFSINLKKVDKEE